MITGHFGFAAAVKGVERTAPLWALMLATVLLDIAAGPLFALGIENIEDAPGTGGGYGNLVIEAEYTHSLVGAAALSAAFGWVAALRWGRRVGILLGGVVFSHWILDLVVHRADMPWLPGNAGGFPLLGFGLWKEKWAAVAVELAIMVVGAALYWRGARQVTAQAGPDQQRRATLIGALMLGTGLAVLALDVTVG